MKYGDVVKLVKDGVEFNALVFLSNVNESGAEVLTVVYMSAVPNQSRQARDCVVTAFTVPPLVPGAKNGWCLSENYAKLVAAGNVYAVSQNQAAIRTDVPTPDGSWSGSGLHDAKGIKIDVPSGMPDEMKVLKEQAEIAKDAKSPVQVAAGKAQTAADKAQDKADDVKDEGGTKAEVKASQDKADVAQVKADVAQSKVPAK